MKTKLCFDCRQDKPTTEFSKSKAKADGLNIICKDCSRRQCREWYKKNRKREIKRIKEGQERRRIETQAFLDDVFLKYPCQLCGEKDGDVLEFHHVRDKQYEVGEMKYRGYLIERVRAEINKCVVLCRNCHRRVHLGKKVVTEAMVCRV